MFEIVFEGTLAKGNGPAAPGPAGVPSAGEVLGFADALVAGTGGLDDAERIDLLRALEVLKCAAEGAQAVVTADFEASQREQAAARGVTAERHSRGIAHQVALARRESPHRGQRHVGLAKVLVGEMPHTLDALRRGGITEWTATVLARETACLGLADRRRIDAELCADLAEVEHLSSRELADAARKLAAELDPASVAARRGKAQADRAVTLRPAPDTMTWLTGHLPVKDGVAVYAALKAEADRLVGVGDGRSRGQIMADTLVDRVLATGRAVPVPAPTTEPGCAPGTEPGSAWGAATSTTPRPGGASGGPAGPGAAGVMVNVVIGADALLAETEEGAEVPGYGPIPADLVREWIRHGLAEGARVELRRLFADPETGQLVRLESRARAFPPALAEFIALRDLRCRTPWCGAPVRHADHVLAHAHDGPTSAGNGQGLCEACNYAKEAVGWHARPRPGPRHRVQTTTPTGHHYTSAAPTLAPPTRPPPAPQEARRPTPRTDLFWAA